MKERWLYVAGALGVLVMCSMVGCLPEKSLATMSQDELTKCIVEAAKRQGYSYSQEWKIRREGDTVTVIRSWSTCESAKAACQPGDLVAWCLGYETTYRVLWQDGRCVLTDKQRSLPREGEVECPPTAAPGSPAETATQTP